MNNKKSLAFIVELFGLFILLVMVIVIITQVLFMSRSQSIRAGNLTEAVVLAENTAEIAASCENSADLQKSLAGMNDVLSADAGGAGLEGSLDGGLDGGIDGGASTDSIYVLKAFNDEDALADRYYLIIVDRSSDEGRAGTYVSDHITVFPPEQLTIDGGILTDYAGDALYSLDTGRFFAKKGGKS